MARERNNTTTQVLLLCVVLKIVLKKVGLAHDQLCWTRLASQQVLPRRRIMNLRKCGNDVTQVDQTTRQTTATSTATTTATPTRGPGTRDCARVVCVRAVCLTSVCDPLHGAAMASTSNGRESRGPTVPRLGRPRRADCHLRRLGRRPVMVHGCSRPHQVVPEGSATGGQLQTGVASRRSRMNIASVMARDDFLPRRSAGGATHTWWRLAWGATGRWWSLPLSAHLLCVAVADATLDHGLFRP